MEILFNSVWFLLVCAMLGHWAWCRGELYPRRKYRPGSSLTLPALACGLLIAFPAISMSDDLQHSSVWLENTETSDVRLKCSLADSSIHSDSNLSWAILPAHNLPPETATAGVLAAAEPLPLGWSEHPVSAERAPPLLS